MPRRGRLHIPGGCYHVIGRGLERRYIFERPEDKEEFLSRLGTNLARTRAQCLAWALMSNHYHFLIRVSSEPLAKLMAPVLSGYAGYYNRRHRRAGYVFQNRFQSILCDADSYLLELVRYIHLNPLRARMIENMEELNSYLWTGHSGILGRRKRSWHDVDEVLCLFGQTRNRARIAYEKFMAAEKGGGSNLSLSGGGLVRSYGGWETLSRLRKEHVSCIGDERILGASAFVENALAQDELKCDLKGRLEQAGWSLDKLVNEVCVLAEVDRRDLNRKARNNAISTAKALVCYWGVEKLGCSAREIANMFQITQPAVSYWINKGRQYCEDKAIEFGDVMS